MRTTIELNDELLRAAKRRAAEERKSLRQVVEAALRLFLTRPRRAAAYGLTWQTERGRVQPGVRLDDRGVLFDVMEARR